jgi:signal peptidase I
LIPKPKTQLGAIVELIVIVALAVGLALGIQAFIVKPYQIPSGSMEPTLDIGQRVLVNRLAYKFGDPSPGDVVVFHPPNSATGGNGPQCGAPHPSDQACSESVPEESDENFIKRIVAGPGDRLRIDHGIPVVNGKPFTGDFETRPCGGEVGCDLPEEITIPPDEYFMMGDNRGHSEDSRFWGPVPKDWIIGKAFFTYWPPGRWGFL